MLTTTTATPVLLAPWQLIIDAKNKLRPLIDEARNAFHGDERGRSNKAEIFAYEAEIKQRMTECSDLRGKSAESVADGLAKILRSVRRFNGTLLVPQ